VWKREREAGACTADRLLRSACLRVPSVAFAPAAGPRRSRRERRRQLGRQQRGLVGLGAQRGGVARPRAEPLGRRGLKRGHRIALDLALAADADPQNAGERDGTLYLIMRWVD